MKENITKFDLEAAFKALDELDVPVAEKGISANRTPLKETFKDRTFAAKTNRLIEDYYDVGNTEELAQAKEDREDEVAKAKLARIEKIVDLDAESPEDLLPSYVGKVIMQCPQCMTLFYKNEEDIEKSEENPEVVNINEPCQHCGNTSGYTLIGKVDKVGEDEADKYDASAFDETDTDNELDLDFEEEEETEEPETEEATEEETTEDADVDTELSDEEEAEEPEVEEGFKAQGGNALTEATEEKENTEDELTEAADRTYIFYVKYTDGETITQQKSGILPREIHEICNEMAEDDEVEGVYVSEIIGGREVPQDKYTISKTDVTIDECAKGKLTEAVDKDLDKKLKEHNDFIDYLQAQIDEKENKLKTATNEFIKEAIQKEIDSLKNELESALPEAVKAKTEIEELSTPEDDGMEDAIESEEPAEETNESLNEDTTLIERGLFDAKGKALDKMFTNYKIYARENSSKNHELVKDKNGNDRTTKKFSDAEKMAQLLSSSSAHSNKNVIEIYGERNGNEELIVRYYNGKIEDGQDNVDLLLKNNKSDKKIDKLDTNAEKAEKEAQEKEQHKQEKEAENAKIAQEKEHADKVYKEVAEIFNKHSINLDGRLTGSNITKEKLKMFFIDSLVREGIKVTEDYIKAIARYIKKVIKGKYNINDIYEVAGVDKPDQATDISADIKAGENPGINTDTVDASIEKWLQDYVDENITLSQTVDALKMLGNLEDAQDAIAKCDYVLDGHGSKYKELINALKEKFADKKKETPVTTDHTSETSPEDKKIDNKEEKTDKLDTVSTDSTDTDVNSETSTDSITTDAHEENTEVVGGAQAADTTATKKRKNTTNATILKALNGLKDKDGKKLSLDDLKLNLKQSKEGKKALATLRQTLFGESLEQPTDDELFEMINEALNHEELAESDMSDLVSELETPVGEDTVQRILDNDGYDFKENMAIKDIATFDELDDEHVEECMQSSLKKVYENVDSFNVTDCSLTESALTISGTINFMSGKHRNTKYVFTEAVVDNKTHQLILTGINEDLAMDGTFTLNCAIDNKSNRLIAESFSYKYTIDNTLVEGLVKHN